MNQDRVIALGFFDGVHRGHGELLRRVTRLAQEKNAIPASFTFDTLPVSKIVGQPVPLINTPQDREWLMKSHYGIQEVVVGHYDDEMMHMPWDCFIRDYLVGQHHAVHLVCGHDYHFGYRGEGSPNKLREFCAKLGVGCDVISKVEWEDITVSSTYIRTLIAQGEMERATEFLGHPHVLTGTVVHGRQLGRTAGFPTANLVIPAGVLVPAYGVYATRVHLPDGRERMAVTNVGCRPTVEEHGAVTVEPWILDFDGDLYGQPLRVEFYRFLRGERRFSSLEELAAMVRQNAEETRQYFARKEGQA